jgi:hypothetical protein
MRPVSRARQCQNHPVEFAGITNIWNPKASEQLIQKGDGLNTSLRIGAVTSDRFLITALCGLGSTFATWTFDSVTARWWPIFRLLARLVILQPLFVVGIAYPDTETILDAIPRHALANA